VAISHTVLAGLIGISKRSVQIAVAHLAGRRLIRQRKGRPTAVPVYTVLTTVDTQRESASISGAGASACPTIRRYPISAAHRTAGLPPIARGDQLAPFRGR